MHITRPIRIIATLGLLASSLVVGITASEVRANNPTPTAPLYQVYVNSSSASPMTFTGRGSWTDTTVGAGLAVPLFTVGSDAQVPFQSTIIIDGLTTAVTAVRAGLDGVSAPGNGCYGSTDAELAAITAYYWTGSAWSARGANALPSAGENRTDCGGAGTQMFTLAESTPSAVTFTKVMFVIDLYCLNTGCTARNGLPPGGTNVRIEIEGSGDGTFNSGKAVDNSTAARGDEAYEVVLGTQAIAQFVGGGTANSLTNDRNEFLDTSTISDSDPPAPGYTIWTGLEAIPSCFDGSDSGPCLESLTPGWDITMIDEGWGQITLRPYKRLTPATPSTIRPLHIEPNDEIEFALRMPKSDTFRSYNDRALTPITNAFSIGFSKGEIVSGAFDESEGSYSVSTFTLRARSTTSVKIFGGNNSTDTNSAGSPPSRFFEDACPGFGQLFVDDGVVYIESDDAFVDGEPNPDFGTKQDDENTDNCQNEDHPSLKSINQVVLVGDPSGNNDRAWIRAAGHTFDIGDKVTVCCVYGAFDGFQTIVAVGNPFTGVVTGSNTEGERGDWFAFSTASSDTYNNVYDNLSFIDGDDADTDPDPDTRTGYVVEREHIRVTESRVTMDLTLRQPLSFDPTADDNDDFLAGGYISTNAQALTFGRQMFDPSNPAFDFGLVGPSNKADGTSRATDGFFHACIPAAFVSRVWNTTVADAQQRINGQAASSAANRNSPVSAVSASCGDVNGVRVSLDEFGYSAPYFAIRPQAIASSPAPAATTPAVTTAPAVVTTPVVAVRPPATVPGRLIPGPGKVVPITTSAPPGVANTVGMKVGDDTITFAFTRPNVGKAQQPARYEVTLVRVGKGVMKQQRLGPARGNRPRSTAFVDLPSGRYHVVIVAKDAKGKTIGRWRSPVARIT